MPRGLIALRRRSLRFAPAILLVVAIAAYATLLSRAHDATKSEMLQRRDEQLFGSSVTGGSNVLIDRTRGQIQLGRVRAKPSDATWRLGPIDEKLDTGTAIQSEEIFVTGLAFSLDTPASVATISLDGRQLQDLRPVPASPRSRGPFAVGNFALQPIDVSPGYEVGFRFPVPADGACVIRACTLAIHSERSVWVIHRVGVLYATQTPRPALWSPALAAWKVFGIAALVAMASHLVLSIRTSKRATRPAKEWKPI